MNSIADVMAALSEAMTPPEDYFGEILELQSQGWARVWGQHRDSDNLEQSNYDVVLKFLKENYELHEDYKVCGSHHWAVGWTDDILVRALGCNCEDWEDSCWSQLAGNLWECETCGFSTSTPRDVFIDMFDFAERIQEYPVLDEEDFSRREYEELVEYLEREVDDDQVEPLMAYLFENHNVSNLDDLNVDWIDEWKKSLKHDWSIIVYGKGNAQIGWFDILDKNEEDADHEAWLKVRDEFPDSIDWEMEEK